MLWITCGLLWCFYQLFGHAFTAEWMRLSHWWANYTMLNFSKSVATKKTNSSTSWMAWGWVHFHRDGIQNIASKIWKKCDASQLDESQLWLIFFTGNCNSTPSETSTSKKDTPLSGEKESPSDTSTNTQVKAALTFTSEENNQGWEWLEGEKTFWFLCFVRKVKMDPHPQRKVKWNHLLRI